MRPISLACSALRSASRPFVLAAALALTAPSAHAQDYITRQTDRAIADYTAGTRALMFHSDNQAMWREQIAVEREIATTQAETIRILQRNLAAWKNGCQQLKPGYAMVVPTR